MATRVLTDLLIQKKAIPRKRKELSDGLAPGLTLRITPRGVRTWSYTWKPKTIDPSTGKQVSGKQQRITIGMYPVMTLEAARVRAVELARIVQDGRNPKSAQASDNTFGGLAEAFMAAKDKTVRLNSSLAIKNALERHVLPAWGALPYEQLDVQSLNALAEQVTADVGASTGEAARKWAKAVFTWAVGSGLIKSHPLAGTARQKRSREQAGRVLSDADIRAVWTASHDTPIVRLLMLTGCRRSEWSGAGWNELNADERTLTIPASRYKTGVTFQLPLTDVAWSIVDALPRTGDLVFGGVDPVDAAVDRVRARTPGVEHWTPHDLRRTCQTRLAALGVSSDVYEACLGHVQPGMRKHYNFHSYSAEKRAAFELYARHLLEIAASSSLNA